MRAGALGVDVVLSRSPEVPPLGSGPPDSGDHAISDEVPLELGDRRHRAPRSICSTKPVDPFDLSKAVASLVGR